MSTTDDPSSQTAGRPAFVHTLRSLRYAVTHVILPIELPDLSDCTLENDHLLARAVSAAAYAYGTHIRGTSEEAQWHRITKMLDNLEASVQSVRLDDQRVISQLQEMQTGDILVFFIGRQNTAMILTKREKCTLCEAFEVSPSEDAVKKSEGPLICSYPGSSVEIPNKVFDDRDFQSQLTEFLSRTDAVDSDPCHPPPAPPQYINTLLDGILRRTVRAVNSSRETERIADTLCITKHVRDEIGGDGWHRSSLWLLMRVAIQMSVDRVLGCTSYKQFVLFFICTLAMDESNANLSSGLLHSMSSKIIQRLSKLGSSIPNWLSEMAWKTCSCLQEILDARWKELNTRISPFRNPSQDELARDTKLSLLNSRGYIQNALENHGYESARTTFSPNHHRRGTLEDFLSSNGSFLDEAYRIDPDVTLYDVKRSVEQGIDDWLACVTNVDEACAQLETLMDRHMMKVYEEQNPEDRSSGILTGIELYVAIDKLAVKEIPMLADYPPEVPVAGLERLLLHKTTSLHRLSRAYQYLSARHSQSRLGWSVLSDEFTEDSFPVSYYDQSPHLQQFKAHIEGGVVWRNVGHGDLESHGGRVDLTRTNDGYQLGLSKSPLPTSPLHMKVVLFELQCPACIRIWRSAAARILQGFCFDMFDSDSFAGDGMEEYDSLLAGVECYLIEHQAQGPSLEWQTHLAYFYLDGSQSGPTLHYVVQYPRGGESQFSLWRPNKYYELEEQQRSSNFSYAFHSRSSAGTLEPYVNSTFHTSNDVLSAQARCPVDLSLDEFIAFAHLRSGGSLQWLNILHGLRSRTLNLRRDDVHYLLSRAAFQVGPLDLQTGTWMWHQELADPSFCNVLLDELDNLFTDVVAGPIDSVVMNTISLLLTRVLASSPDEDTLKRAVKLLRSVRRKTFCWVQELSYDLTKAPANEERKDLLLDMAATCRSTFNADPATLGKLVRSAEDVDVLLSCTLFIHVLRPYRIHYQSYLVLLIGRDRCLSHALEEISRIVILADASDYGVDLAVARIFTTYQPDARRWEQLQHPNARWLTCDTNMTMNRFSQTVHVNLLNGALRVDARPGRLPDEIWRSPEYNKIFGHQGFFFLPSNLPEMDFMTPSMASNRKVHFSLRDNNLVVRVQSNQTNEILELIPSSKLKADLPPALVDGHIHWLNLSTRIIEIHPLEQLWEESSENWKIDCTSGQYHMYKGLETLADIRSPTWAMFVECFHCLNSVNRNYLDDKDVENLLITTSPIDSVQPTLASRLSVTLPRYGLSFFVNESEELESCDFMDMVYDEDQSIGTLLGLRNLLVLRPKTHLAGTHIPEGLTHRRVLIPNGYPVMHGDHHIQIDRSFLLYFRSLTGRRLAPEEPLYHTYNVDIELGCLTGNGSLTSTGFLADLHAMTSRHLPDPLTGKMGIQAALCLLRSAGCQSIMLCKALDDPSSQNPLFKAAYVEIENRYYWDSHSGDQERVDVLARAKRAERQAAYLFSSNATGPRSPRNIPRAGPPTQIMLDHLMCNGPAPKLLARTTLLRSSDTTSSPGISKLDQLFSSLRLESSFHREYLTNLNASAQHIRVESGTSHIVVGEDPIETLKGHYAQCRANYLGSLDILKESLSPKAGLSLLCHWPPITADVLLRYLASTSPVRIALCWKKCLTSLALLLLDLQRARRLLRFALDGLNEEFSKELENEGCDGWDPEVYPDWLLIQIQGNFLIRRDQVEIAMEMISPQSGQNTVMQVNMGEGKSPVIIPIAAAALADGKQLARVIVPKALTIQMFEILVALLGGLANRPIYHLPFSRSGMASCPQIDDMHRLASQCMAERGILLVQPEHVVSLKLMAVEQQMRRGKLMTNLSTEHQNPIYKYTKIVLSLRSLQENSLVGNIFRLLNQTSSGSSKQDNAWTDNNSKCGGDVHGASDNASKWLGLQKWLRSHVRDILDESDEILHARFQLVYTFGLQQQMDGYPDRWMITQQVLILVKKHVYSISRYAPESIEYDRGPPGSFPHVRILRPSDICSHLISSITQDVMDGQLPSFQFQHVSSTLHDAIRSFISHTDVLRVPETVKMVEEYAETSTQSHLWSGLLLLRGLLTSNILFFALAERRWRVDYGLVPRPEFGPIPTMLAVPYRAKDVPAPNTQFGHPDLTIVLTCLSYYYTGLTEDQLRRAFELLVDRDDPSTEYALWVKEYDCGTLPDSLQTLSDTNMRSSEQWDKDIFPLFFRNQAVIDFYLSRVVFPREAKQLPWKFAGSSWDLADKRKNLVTGFSGTNDGQWLLPLSIAQHDLDHQKGTNARVLVYLLQHENDAYMVIHNDDEGLSTHAFLREVTAQKPEIRVLLDVGSQILDLSNRQVVTAWLQISRDTVGAVYFSENDELMLLMPNGKSLPLLSSPLSQQLGRCVVYLDHAHTRGTDIKLPVGSRAAVTLGPKVTKDALVQGCMRMRKLGHGHSVMFFAPPGIDHTIRAVAGKRDPNTQVTTIDILCWAIRETWTDIQQRAPYWAQQGMNHKSRSDAWSCFAEGKITREKLVDAWLQPDSKSLADLYAPCESKNASSDLSMLAPGIRQRCKDLGVLSHPSAQMDEEQEREIHREREREREAEQPPEAKPAKHSLHQDVVSFVKTGVIPPLHSGSAFLPVFTSLEKSSATTCDADVWSPLILATADFCNTIEPDSTLGTIDQYLRPVQWILSRRGGHDHVLVLLSPFEANDLMPDIRASEFVHLHLYASRTAQRMKSSDDFQLYTIPALPSDWTPPWDLIDQLNIFAGQLYIRDYQSYLQLCSFLGVRTKESLNDAGVPRNLFKIPGSFEKMEITFSGSPLPFVMALLAIRTRGRPFEHTHMGKILQGKILTKKEFEQ